MMKIGRKSTFVFRCYFFPLLMSVLSVVPHFNEAKNGSRQVISLMSSCLQKCLSQGLFSPSRTAPFLPVIAERIPESCQILDSRFCEGPEVIARTRLLDKAECPNVSVSHGLSSTREGDPMELVHVFHCIIRVERHRESETCSFFCKNTNLAMAKVSLK